MVSSDGGGRCSIAEDERPKRQKTEKSYRKRQKKHSFDKYTSRLWGRAPSKVMVYTGTVACDEARSLLTAQVALSGFNERSKLNEQGPYEEYELVRVLGCVITSSYRSCCPCLHCNFIARPKNQSNESLAAEDNCKLFFGEVKGHRSDSHCSFCCILGPPGTVTGLCGCDLHCRYLPELIQHPEGGGYKMKCNPDLPP
ncbi:unnamed protein product [Cuscuta epithymum]|uniref:DUF3615 domain-containing protein n=1 Tax=Cuscuta epithymum TaxID=186058 RepID=A0AAV0CV06_9ASTE|nr:unnamed protein product [Cuscuta epithymum]CAH9132476.1 unnamed protein product [Cuscuta epithymum]